MEYLLQDDADKPVAPIKGEGRSTANAAAPKFQKPSLHFQASDLSGQSCPATNKTFATLRALLAMGGYALYRSDAADGLQTYYVTRWGVARQLADFAAVVGFARQVGVVE